VIRAACDVGIDVHIIARRELPVVDSTPGGGPAEDG
jgi:hypothetical protein